MSAIVSERVKRVPAMESEGNWVGEEHDGDGCTLAAARFDERRPSNKGRRYRLKRLQFTTYYHYAAPTVCDAVSFGLENLL